ncbi:MAG: hypothetical protein VB858_18055 [Planctomycetaceae bacterium]
MWIHPGGIKQGVNLREEFGPVLQPQQKYQLVITQAVRGAAGRPLSQRYVKPFTTASADHTRPGPSRWKLDVPSSGTRDLLPIRFEKPLDQVLLQKMLKVQSGHRGVSGTIRFSAGGTMWSFIPQAVRDSPTCPLHVDGNLEDFAGNTLRRVFNTDLTTLTADSPQTHRN